ncbi:MAG: M20/M25/M40 family metallo-hydrolase [Parvularculaceae bacterium]
MMIALKRGDTSLLLLAAAFLALFMLKGDLAPAPRIDAKSEFDADRALERLARILGDERPHTVDTDANDAVRERLLGEIRAIGFEPEVRDDFACRPATRWNAVSCARVRNVVFRTGPDDGQAIMVMSHHDSVAAGPGAADDGAGMASALEIAAILKKRRPVKPIIFLITDGEEPGLIGAHSFVRKDPLAKTVAAVINMEARGASGPAILFQLSDPNGRDIHAYSNRAKAPVGNSLATDIYKMLPNDTDVSVLLPLGVDAVNLAFAERAELYHTPRDTIGNLNRRSFAHLGMSALAALDGFLRDVDHAEKKPEPRRVFSDVLTRIMIVTPQLAGLAMIVLGLAASATAFLRMPGDRPFRAAFVPIAAMAAAGIVAFLCASFLGLVRAETAYWSAEPHWTRAVIYLSAISAGVGVLALGVGADRRRMLCAAWFWFSLIGFAAYWAAPGSALLTGLPASLFACAVLASAGATRLLAPLSLLGLAAALLLWLPALHHAEIGLGLGSAWPFAVLAALIFMLAAPIVTAETRLRPGVLLTPAALLFAAIVLAATARAYSPAAPRGFNIQHILDAQTGEAVFALAAGGEAPPASFSSVGDFEKREIKGLAGKRHAAAAPAHDGRAVGVDVVSSLDQEFGRTIALTFAANGADEILIIAPDEAGLVEARAGDEIASFDERGVKYIRCSGRACAEFSVTATVGLTPAEWTVLGVRHGLGAEGAPIDAVRPDWSVPVHGGDARLVLSRVSI